MVQDRVRTPLFSASIPLLTTFRVAATIYHLFLAEDNSPDLFAQLKRIHSMVPYTVMKNVIRIANPAAVMSGVLDLFLAQPFGSRSLLQRIFGMAINDGINAVQKTIDTLSSSKIKDPVLCDKIKAYTDSDEAVKGIIRQQAESEQVDILVAVLRSDFFEPELSAEQIGTVFNAYVAWNNAVENVRTHMRAKLGKGNHLEWQRSMADANYVGRRGNALGSGAFRTSQTALEAQSATERQEDDA